MYTVAQSWGARGAELKIANYHRARYNIDPDDNMFLAAAYEAKADYLVSLDNHLLSLKFYHGTQILTPGLFLRAS